jgi:hypothetical protein
MFISEPLISTANGYLLCVLSLAIIFGTLFSPRWLISTEACLRMIILVAMPLGAVGVLCTIYEIWEAGIWWVLIPAAVYLLWPLALSRRTGSPS